MSFSSLLSSFLYIHHCFSYQHAMLKIEQGSPYEVDQVIFAAVINPKSQWPKTVNVYFSLMLQSSVHVLPWMMVHSIIPLSSRDFKSSSLSQHIRRKRKKGKTKSRSFCGPESGLYHFFIHYMSQNSVTGHTQLQGWQAKQPRHSLREKKQGW